MAGTSNGSVPPPEETLDELYENAPCGYLTVDAQGQIARVNTTLVRWLGVDRGDLLGRSAQALLTPAGRVFYQTHVAPLLQVEGAARQVAIDLACSYNKRLSVISDWRRVEDAQGHTLGFRVMLVDASDRRAYERDLIAEREHARETAERLRESEERYRGIVEGAEEFAIVRLDGRGVISAWNSGAERIMGWRPDEAVGEPGAMFFTLKDREGGVPDHEMNRAKADGKVVDERWHLRRDGSRFWGSGLMMRLEGSEFLKIFRDRTAEHEAEQRARESGARFAAALTVARLGAFEWCPETDEVLFDVRCRELLGFSPEEPVRGADVFARIHPLEVQHVQTVTADAVAAGTRLEAEYRVILPDGSIRMVRSVSDPIAGADGRTKRMVGVFDDVTERRAAVAALHDLNETLEARVAERGAQLEQAHEQLRQSQKLEAMGSLTGGVAHDFNNLLTPIVGGLDLLQRRGLGDERAQRLIAGALQSAERARTLVQRLLAFARRQPLQPTAVDVVALVRGMADLLASTTGPQVKIVVEAPDELPSAIADANQLEMALLNLSVNARDAMTEGGTLTISLATHDVAGGEVADLCPGRYLRLGVTDTGMGMSEDTAARAIEPFFSTKGVGKGTGLGLSMAHGLAAQLGGALGIASRPGHGTRIDLWLPIAATEATRADATEDVATYAASGTVLLVDDEDLVRASTVEMLSDLGFDVVEASSSDEAKRLITDGLALDLLVSTLR